MCPKCGQYYCSTACYNCEKHLNCSEAFYKKCVQDELRCERPTDDVRRRTLEIIKREYEQLAGQDDLGIDLDELREQFSGLHLANERHLWSQLSEEEKRNFERLLERNEIGNLLPADCWTPWYLKVEPKRLVELVHNDEDASANEQNDFDSKKNKLFKEIEDKLKELNCRVPALDRSIQRLTDLTRIKPSPHVKCAVINALFAYCFVCRTFSNDHLSFAVESFRLFDELSLLTQREAVFASTRQAIQFAIQLLINRQKARTDFVLVLIDDLKFILNHPDKIYLNIIADLIRLTKLYRQSLKRRPVGAKADLGADLQTKSDSNEQSDSERTRDEALKKVGALLKKLEYYLSYSNESQDELIEQIAEIEMERRYLLELKRSIDQNLEAAETGEIKIR